MTHHEPGPAGRDTRRANGERRASAARADAAARLRQAAGLPELLAASLNAFETIRMLARQGEDQDDELVATFMMAADAAVTGRETLAAAPALVQAGGHRPDLSEPRAADLVEVIVAAARLATLTAERLSSGLDLAMTAGDRTACRDGSTAARQIEALLAGGRR
jgi:hypothetical protein